MGFFAFVLELLAGLLSTDLSKKIEPGYSAMHAVFTQIYDKTQGKIPELLNNKASKELQRMPKINRPTESLEDIYNLGKRPPRTETIKWIIKNKE